MNTYEVIWTRLAEKIKGSRRGGKRKKEWTKPELLALMRDLELEALKENRLEDKPQYHVPREGVIVPRGSIEHLKEAAKRLHDPMDPEEADHRSTTEASISNDAQDGPRTSGPVHPDCQNPLNEAAQYRLDPHPVEDSRS